MLKFLIPRIKRLVAGSIVGLTYDNVTVIPDRARYAEESLRDLELTQQEEKQYVSIWSVIVAKESATRFRILFFTFTLSILIILLFFVWIFWKIFPLLQQQGGIKSLFHLHPIVRAPAAKKSDKGKEEDTEVETEAEEPAEPEEVDEEPEERS